MEKETAISVFNFYNVNPTNEEDLKSFDYRKIKKVKVNNKNIFKGENKMNNTTLITKETPAVQMSFVERETARLKKSIEELKNQLETNIISEVEFESASKKKTKQNTAEQKLKAEITKLETELENLKPFHAAVDVGKYNTKSTYVVEGQETYTTNIFESRVQRSSECSHHVGKKIFVGKEPYATTGSAKRVSDENVVNNESLVEPMNNTKAHEYHRVLLLKALYNIYLETGRKVFDVGVGTSIDNYIEDSGARVYLTMLDEKLPEALQAKVDQAESRKEENEIYKEYAETLKSKFISKEFVVRETGAEPVTIVINDLYVAPETVTGATKIDVDDLAHAYIIDIGGLNESYLPIVNFAPIFESVLTDKNGMAHKYEYIANWIVSKSSEVTSISRDSIEAVLNNREMLDPYTEELIQDYMKSYLDKLTSKLKRNTVVLKEGVTTLIFIGGGSQVLAPYIRNYYTNVCNMQGKLHIAEENGIFSNVTGIYDAAKDYFDDRQYIKSTINEAC